MKRSDLLLLIRKQLIKSYPILTHYSEDFANEFLTLVEQEGMLPPKYQKRTDEMWNDSAYAVHKEGPRDPNESIFAHVDYWVEDVYDWEPEELS